MRTRETTQITDFQRKCVDALCREPNRMASSATISHRARVARIAVASAMRGLERKGLVLGFPSDNTQWAVTYWALTRLGKAELHVQ
jgi:hypothetical protein